MHENISELVTGIAYQTALTRRERAKINDFVDIAVESRGFRSKESYVKFNTVGLELQANY